MQFHVADCTVQIDPQLTDVGGIRNVNAARLGAGADSPI
jgi:hypothetical protein